MVEALRTPDERFTSLPDFEYEPQYLENLSGFENLRLHYIDLGPKEAAHTFLCLHGEPTWAYLFRRMIGPFLEAGSRVVAPDFYGFGRSDTRGKLREFFEVSREFVVLAALKALADEGSLEASAVSAAMRSLGISPDKIDPLTV